MSKLEKALRHWFLQYRVSGAESFYQTDRVNEALPCLGELIGKHIGYPEYDEQTGELKWPKEGT